MKWNILTLIKEQKAKHGCNMKYSLCDNSSENLALDVACKQDGLSMHCEYTKPSSPQQNGRVERNFAILLERELAMLNSSGFDKF